MATKVILSALNFIRSSKKRSKESEENEVNEQKKYTENLREVKQEGGRINYD